jgi:GTPase SAR1 family protein
MGCNSSTTIVVTNAVDQQLLDAQDAEKYNHKILLLGAGESGKSTVVKQIKMIWKVGGGPSDKEKQEYILAIRRNCIEAIQTLLEASKNLDVPLKDKALTPTFEKLLAMDTNTAVTPEIGNDISKLWLDEGIQVVYSRKDEFWNMDATAYYLNEVVRLAEEDYVPNEDDMIMTRVRTTGIVITEVKDAPFTYQVVDVGGQRSERRKWIHCFDDVRAIIFLEGLAGYNQVLFEDNTVNRMAESLNLFEEVVKNPLFQKTPFFVFLNKKVGIHFPKLPSFCYDFNTFVHHIDINIQP